MVNSPEKSHTEQLYITSVIRVKDYCISVNYIFYYSLYSFYYPNPRVSHKNKRTNGQISNKLETSFIRGFLQLASWCPLGSIVCAMMSVNMEWAYLLCKCNRITHHMVKLYSHLIWIYEYSYYVYWTQNIFRQPDSTCALPFIPQHSEYLPSVPLSTILMESLCDHILYQ